MAGAVAPATGTIYLIEPELESYRWQIALLDTSTLALLMTGNKTAIGAAAVTYFVGGPIIHLSHDATGRAAGSLALRVVLPLAGAFGLAALAEHNSHCTPEDDDCDSGAWVGAIFGFGLGALTAMVVDTALIARPMRAQKDTGVTWAPQIGVTSQHVNLGVVGRF